MKNPKHIEEAKAIGADSYELLEYNQLPDNASAQRQAEALNSDATWQEDHNVEIQYRIRLLINSIEEEQP